MAYQFKPNVKEIIYPPRIQAIADEYASHGFEYTGPTLDTDSESFKEMGYERRVKSRPDTAYMILYSVYRIFDEISGDEFMLWKEIKYVKDRDDKEIHIEVVMGKRPRFDVVPVLDEEGHEIDKRISKWNMVYTTKWDQGHKLDELIKQSRTKRTAFYIAYSSPDYYTNYTGTPIRIKELDKYKKMSFSELMDYDKTLEMARKMQIAKSGK
jgi:hypothetical protein